MTTPAITVELLRSVHHPGAQGVEVNVADKFEKVFFLIADE
jgi:hypothetical protein